MDKEIINKIKYTVLDFDPKAEIILFGSRARGDEKPDSDWDLLILTSFAINEKKKRELRDKLFYVELETEQSFSSIIHSKIYWEQLKVTSLYRIISKEGNPI